MKVQKLVLGLLGMSMFLTSCNEEGAEITPNKVTFSASVGSPMTRATETAWEANDAIGVYALKNGQALADASIYESKKNIKYVTAQAGATGDFDAATTSEAIELTDEVVDFIAYHPYSDKVTADYKVAINVADQSVKGIDMLYATKQSHTNSQPDVNLVFNHVMSRVKVVLQPKQGTNLDVTNAKITLKNALTQGTLSLIDGTVEKGTDKADIDAVNGSAILVPGQDMAEITVKIVLADGKTYEWTPTTNVLEGGKSSTYTLTLTKGGVIANTTGNINGFGQGTGGNETLDPKTDSNANTGGTTPPTPDPNAGTPTPKPDPATPQPKLLFAGADFSDLSAITMSNKYAKLTVEQAEGKDGGKAMHISGKAQKTDLLFEMPISADADIANKTKVSFYIKGTSTERSLQFILGNLKFNLEDISADKPLDKASKSKYDGVINANDWVKVTLNLGADAASIPADAKFAFRVGGSTSTKDVNYDLYIDKITIE